MTGPVDQTLGRVAEVERLRRWRLILGGTDDGSGEDGTGTSLGGNDVRIDAALGAVYDRPPQTRGGRRRGGLGASAPGVARWLGDLRRFFPTPVVQVIQRDAIDRLRLRQLLLEPEMLDAIEPDVSLVATLLELRHLLPDASHVAARRVIATVVAELEDRLASATRQAVTGALARDSRTRRPRPADIDWNRTIRANLATYQPELRTVIPEKLVGYGRRQSQVQREFVLAIDQSGSMAESVVYASVFAAALASIRALRVSVVAFDTEVVDLSHLALDAVDLLFGLQLGGGTDIDRAIAYCEQLVTRPADTVLVLISDLHDGGVPDGFVRRLGSLAAQGVTVIALLALADDGAPAYDHGQAAALAAIGIAAFACTPDRFADLVAAAIERRDIARWAGGAGLVTAAPIRHR